MSKGRIVFIGLMFTTIILILLDFIALLGVFIGEYKLLTFLLIPNISQIIANGIFIHLIKKEDI